jgi:hypothetical protein
MLQTSSRESSKSTSGKRPSSGQSAEGKAWARDRLDWEELMSNGMLLHDHRRQ